MGHGSNYGILGPNGNMITWQDIGAWINTLPSTYVFFLSCDSNNSPKYIHIPGHGFSGTIDGVLGAISVAAMLQHANGNTEAVQQLVSQFVSRMILLQTDKAKLIPLICIDSPTQSSSLSLSNTSPDTGVCPPPPPPPPTTYTVTFSESGLPSGISWPITFNGVTQSVSSSSISFTVSSGNTYSYTIWSVADYSMYGPSPSSGAITVNSNINQAITYTPSPCPYTYLNAALNLGSFLCTYVAGYLTWAKAIYDSIMFIADLISGILSVQYIKASPEPWNALLESVLWGADKATTVEMITNVVYGLMGLFNDFLNQPSNIPTDLVDLGINIATVYSSTFYIIASYWLGQMDPLTDVLIIAAVTAALIAGVISSGITQGISIAFSTAVLSLDLANFYNDYTNPDMVSNLRW